ncbi:MAG: trypsin-like peptidase domain-containing protein [Holophaga sp.]|nr:trypsin-like peptidase domain-containing protein [Holophaga sp.]
MLKLKQGLLAPRDERMLQYILDLQRRDRRGPGDFEIRPGVPAPPEGGSRQPRSPEAMSRSASLIRRKRAEALNAGVATRFDVAGPPPGPRKPQADLVQTLTRPAAEAFDRLLNGKPLLAMDLIHLESIVLPALRPAYDILNGTYDTLPKAWEPFNRQRAAIEPLIRGVGRLQLTGHPSQTLVGTGLVCGPNVILTNAHVAQVFVQGIGSGQTLSFLPGVTCAMEMYAEVGSPNSLKLDLSRPIAASAYWDLALLRVEALPPGVAPVALSGSEPADLADGYATIIGYPSYSPFESFVDQATIFRSVFDRKRLQPGMLKGMADVPSCGRYVKALAHDCSTLGGNSGSALVSADLAKVVGIHFCGITHVANYAIPAWMLAEDPVFQNEAINFT